MRPASLTGQGRLLAGPSALLSTSVNEILSGTVMMASPFFSSCRTLRLPFLHTGRGHQLTLQALQCLCKLSATGHTHDAHLQSHYASLAAFHLKNCHIAVLQTNPCDACQKSHTVLAVSDRSGQVSRASRPISQVASEAAVRNSPFCASQYNKSCMAVSSS